MLWVLWCTGWRKGDIPPACCRKVVGGGSQKPSTVHGGCTIAAPGCTVLEVSAGVGICHPMADGLCGEKAGAKPASPPQAHRLLHGVVALMFAITASLGDCLCPRAAVSCPPSTRLGDAVGSSHCPPSSLPGRDSHAHFPQSQPTGDSHSQAQPPWCLLTAIISLATPLPAPTSPLHCRASSDRLTPRGPPGYQRLGSYMWAPSIAQWRGRRQLAADYFWIGSYPPLCLFFFFFLK